MRSSPAMIERSSSRPQPHIVFGLLLVLSLLLFQATARDLLNLALDSERYTHIVLVPLISLGFLYWERSRIFRNITYSLRLGLPLLLLGVSLHYGSRAMAAPLQIAAFSVILTWTAAFILCYGTRSWLAAGFPIGFQLLMIPLPASFMDSASSALQYGSAEMTSVLFNLLGIPVFRQGYTFALPGVSIEIAEECSGIRSSIALVITSILAGHVFLQSSWKKFVLLLVTIPITLFKNAVRITVLASLGAYVDRDFLYGDLHHRGGVVFSVLALAMFLPLLLALYRSETGTHPKQPDLNTSVSV